jgi:chromosome partitioning protein
VRRIAICSAKGGTGKTTTAVSLAHGLALAGNRVLLVDCDPRRDAALHWGLAPEGGLAAWLRGRPARAIEVRAGLHVLDSGGDALTELEGSSDPATESQLQRALAALQSVDFVLVDCPAGSGGLVRAALRSCEEMLIPASADYLGLAATLALLERLATMSASSPRPLHILGVLPTFYDEASQSASALAGFLASSHARKTLQTRIAFSDALRTAPERRGTIFESDPLSRAALDYASLTEEVLAGAP